MSFPEYLMLCSCFELLTEVIIRENVIIISCGNFLGWITLNLTLLLTRLWPRPPVPAEKPEKWITVVSHRENLSTDVISWRGATIWQHYMTHHSDEIRWKSLSSCSLLSTLSVFSFFYWSQRNSNMSYPDSLWIIRDKHSNTFPR